VRDANSAQPWVLAVDGWRARRRAVKLGLKGDGRIEVLEGVAPGDRLISAANGTVREGQRVRATAPAKSSAP
jgi:HlyD family secretion protein